MSDKKSVFNETLDLGYEEELRPVDYEGFRNIVENRRSIRVFKDQSLPENLVKNALEDGLMAPNSSNLQPWQFIWVRKDEVKKDLAKNCFSQNGARTASDLIVCVAKTNTWKENCKKTLKAFKDSEMETPKVVEDYYTKIAPAAYGLMGPMGIFSPFKWLFLNTLGLFQVMAREPIWPSQLKTWAVKSTALACENIMLSLSAQGADSLPMEGFDAKRVKKMFGLGRHDHVVMIIGAGYRSSKGVYGPRMRFDSTEFIQEIK